VKTATNDRRRGDTVCLCFRLIQTNCLFVFCFLCLCFLTVNASHVSPTHLGEERSNSECQTVKIMYETPDVCAYFVKSIRSRNDVLFHDCRHSIVFLKPDHSFYKLGPGTITL
jgi:hypothetical protein